MAASEELQYDTGYAWVIMIAIVLNNFVSIAYAFGSSGVLSAHYPQLLGLDVSSTNLISSVLSGVFLCSTPLNAMLIKRFGIRQLAGIGCFLHLLAITVSAFGSQLWHLVLGYSVIGGIGMSINMMATVEIVPHYFKVRAMMAYAGLGVGCGVGYMFWPYTLKAILSVNTYRDTMLYVLPIAAISISAPILFKERKPKTELETAASRLRAFLHPLKRFNSPFCFLNSFLWKGGHIGMAIILYNYVKLAYDEETAAINATIYGSCNLMAGVLLAVILWRFKINHLALQIACNCIGGVCCMLLAAYNNKISFYIFSAILGFAHSLTISNMSCLCRHLYPPQDVEYSFAFLDCAGALGGFLGPFTAGLIQHQFGRMDYGPYYLGSLLLLGGITMITMICIRREFWQNYSNRNKKGDKCSSEPTHDMSAEAMIELKQPMLEVGEHLLIAQHSDPKA